MDWPFYRERITVIDALENGLCYDGVINYISRDRFQIAGKSDEHKCDSPNRDDVLITCRGNGFGCGRGYGRGSFEGDGSGYGACSAYGYGSQTGFGYGYGRGYGYGEEDGSGTGDGDGYGDASPDNDQRLMGFEEDNKCGP